LVSFGASSRLPSRIRSWTWWWHFRHPDSVNRCGSIGKSQKWIDCQLCSLVQRAFATASLGVCVASTNVVALPWPEWQMEQPNFSAGCGLLESTNRSSRGWAAYSLIRAGLRGTRSGRS
jgi:hypothetical protein